MLIHLNILKNKGLKSQTFVGHLEQIALCWCWDTVGEIEFTGIRGHYPSRDILHPKYSHT